ncbi:DUT1 [Ecytonucleospora hepatopenaei]|uniref:Deoxyuridine 5'-triphosphate nucleotidohydrolase n=1 Tax=Ecytonucleospora hepatopenaei TaxID=646526 RepID=A0A1W0E8W1_9MICR|nr:DUT1 [Ecytonucleospora hepatopenaei]
MSNLENDKKLNNEEFNDVLTTNIQFNKNPFNVVKFYTMTETAIAPERHTDGAAGYDLRSIQNAMLMPGESVKIKTGLFIDLPNEYFGIILSRSGLSVKNGIEVVNSYVEDRKEIEVSLLNHSSQPFNIEIGMRIAQLVFMEKNEKKFMC